MSGIRSLPVYARRNSTFPHCADSSIYPFSPVPSRTILSLFAGYFVFHCPFAYSILAHVGAVSSKSIGFTYQYLIEITRNSKHRVQIGELPKRISRDVMNTNFEGWSKVCPRWFFSIMTSELTFNSNHGNTLRQALVQFVSLEGGSSFWHCSSPKVLSKSGLCIAPPCPDNSRPIWI